MNLLKPLVASRQDLLRGEAINTSEVGDFLNFQVSFNDVQRLNWRKLSLEVDLES